MTRLEARAVSARLGARQVLAEVSCALADGEMLGIIGPNGAGKSSLMRVLAGLVEPAAGEVLAEGRPLAQWPRRELARTLAFLPQSTPVHWPLAVRAVVELGRLPYRQGWFGVDDDAGAAVSAAMAEAEVDALQDRLLTELSGGERARVMIARLLAGNPRVILADEPVAALDAYHQLHVMEVLARHARQGAAVAVILHDLGLAARFCQRVLLLDKGRVVACGTPAEVLRAEWLEPVYGVRLRIIDSDGLRVIVPWERGKEAPDAQG